MSIVVSSFIFSRVFKFVYTVQAQCHSTHVNALLCGCFEAAKAQKRKPRALFFHTLTIYSQMLLFLVVAKCKLCVASFSPTLRALNRIYSFVTT